MRTRSGHVLALVVAAASFVALARAEVNATSCVSSTECANLGLESAACQDGVCVSTSAASRWRAEVAGSIAAFLSNVLAAGSGLGGGGLLVPMYILTMGLSSHDAIPLSKATIFGSAIASFIINARHRHPLSKKRPLIDYETMLLMEPMTLAGTIIGVNMNAVFPEWLITVCVVVLLTWTTVKTYRKGQKVWREETMRDQKVCSDVLSYWRLLPHQHELAHFDVVAHAYLKWKRYRRKIQQQPETVSLKVIKDDGSETASTQLSPVTDTDTSDSDNSENETLIHAGVLKSDVQTAPLPSVEKLEQKRNGIPGQDLLVLCLLWVALVLFSLAKGGHGHASIVGLQCGSFGYWILIAASFPMFIAATMYFGIKVVRTHRLLDASRYNYLKGDMVWTKEAIIKYPSICTAAGVAAGLLGIGGGMVKGPLLLAMGLLPQVASATSSAMILFTASSTTVQFIILGALDVKHALWHGFVGFVAGIVGQYGLAYVVKKYRKTALVIWLVALIIGLSCLIMGVIGIENVFRQGFGGFRPLCSGA